MKRSAKLENYIANMFFTYFAYSYMTTLFIWVFIDFVGLLGKFMGHPMLDILTYYAYYIPYITVMTIPTSVMLASLFAFSSLSSSNEVTAMKSAGMATFRIILPIIRLSFLFSILVFLLSEFVQPKTEMKRAQIYKENFNKSSKKIKVKYTDIWYLGLSKSVYNVQRVSVGDSTLNNIVIYDFTELDEVEKIYTAKKGIQLANKKWEFLDIVEIKLDSNSEKTRTAKKDTISIKENYSDFLVEQKPPQTMSFIELKYYINKMERTGFKMDGLWADFHNKFAFPFITVIIIFLTAPMVLRHQRGGNGKNIGMGLVIIFGYYIFMKLGLALGHSGLLPPVLAAWIGNIFYSGLALFIFRKYRY